MGDPRKLGSTRRRTAAGWFCALTLACLPLTGPLGCGGSSTRDPDGTGTGQGDGATLGAGGDSTGRTGSSSAGIAGFSTETDGSGAGAAGSGGSVVESGKGSAGAAGQGPGEVPSLDDPREQEILAPLWTDPARLDAAAGEELLELVYALGRARGYAVCRCGLSPDEAPDDELFERLAGVCAADETMPLLRTPAQLSCMREFGPEVPGLDEYLRCSARRTQYNAFERDPIECLGLNEPNEPHLPPSDCPLPAMYEWLRDTCLDAYFCADQTRVNGRRCDGRAQCEDASDEFSCYEDVGRDDYLCAGVPVSPMLLCDSDCGPDSAPPHCDFRPHPTFVCRDGSELPIAQVCDREPDCSEGEDESQCLR